ncbi:IS630 family transposase [Cohaesibacter sp. ES.047]|nr:IS630 family transposase [Cohaesibacter sp. ES.047]
MSAALILSDAFDADSLRRLAKGCRNAKQSRRLLAIAAVYDGMNRADAAKVGGMDRQTLRDWVLRFNEQGTDGLVDIKATGAPMRLSPEQLEEFVAIVETGPDPEKDGVSVWRSQDLVRVIQERFGVSYKERGVRDLLRRMGYVRISGRPQHPEQKPEVIDAFKKTSPQPLAAHVGHLPKNKPIEIWWQDEARLGQKNGLARLWAKKGTRPRLPADQRYKNAYLFGAICPARGVGAGLMMPFANTQAMQMHLEEVSRTVARGAHAVVLMDRAGWHTTSRLNVPKNITILLLPSKSPELNPVENIWQYLRGTFLSNRVFEDYAAILDAGCQAWKSLSANPTIIHSIGMRKWAQEGQN